MTRKEGRIAVLTNYRDDSSKAVGLRSRGSIVNEFLEARVDDGDVDEDGMSATKKYVEDLVSGGDAQQAGGFSLACGTVKGPLAVVSNRVSATEGIEWIAKEKGETVALSNTAFGDRSWPKITNGEELLKEAIHASVKLGESEDELIWRLLELLSTDTLPRLSEGESMERYIDLLRQSIFIPAIGRPETPQRGDHEVCSSNGHEKAPVVPDGDLSSYMRGPYGTQTQTVILVGKSGRVKFFERTLYDDNARAVPIGEGDRVYEFLVGQ